MDVLVRWRDGFENVVDTSELKTLNQEEIKVGCSVKMLYKCRWRYGKVIAIEHIKSDVITSRSGFDSEDDVPLAEFQKMLKKF